MLSRGDHVPHFAVTPLDGRPFSYGSIWQQRNLVLISLPAASPANLVSYSGEVQRILDTEFATDVECVVTTEPIPGVPSPGLLIVDRWGEVRMIADGTGAPLPSPADVADWVQHIRMACPECEGGPR